MNNKLVNISDVHLVLQPTSVGGAECFGLVCRDYVDVYLYRNCTRLLRNILRQQPVIQSKHLSDSCCDRKQICHIT